MYWIGRSARLKKLVEDPGGGIQGLNRQHGCKQHPYGVGVLLTQAAGEYEERMR